MGVYKQAWDKLEARLKRREPNDTIFAGTVWAIMDSCLIGARKEAEEAQKKLWRSGEENTNK